MYPLIKSLLDVEPDEVKPAGFCFAISFWWGFSQMFSWTASSALFLQYYNASDLPIVSLVSAALIPLGGVLFLRLSRSLRFATLFCGFALAFGVCQAAFRLLLAGPSARWPAMGLAIWYNIEFAFSTLLTVGLINRLFNLRQVKRVFSPITTGADSAGILAGLLLSLVVKRLGVENLLLISAAVNFLNVALFVVVAKLYGNRLGAGEPHASAERSREPPGAGRLPPLFRSRLVWCVLAAGALAEFNLEFINNAFYNQAEAFLRDPREMAAFLGQFFAVASVLSTLVQSLVATRLIKTLGIGGCLILGPLLVGLMLAGFVGLARASPAPFWLFVSMAGAKFVQYTLMTNINDAAYFTLIRSLAPGLRERVNALANTVLAPLCAGLSGGVLLLLTKTFQGTAVAVSVAALAIIALRIVVGGLTARAYGGNLRNILNARVLRGSDVPLDDVRAVSVLLASAKSTNPRAVRQSLELLSSLDHPGVKAVLAHGLHHHDPDVRLRAAEAYGRLGAGEDAPLLAARLAVEPEPRIMAALLPALARVRAGENQVELAPYLGHADPRVVLGACAGLIQHGDPERAGQARTVLARMARSPDAQYRALAAEALGRTPGAWAEPLLAELLADADLQVLGRAIEAAGRLAHPDYGAVLVRHAETPALRTVAMRALVQAGAAMVPALEAAYYAPSQSTALKRTIVHIYGRMNTDLARSRLKEKLHERDREVLEEVLPALERCGYQAVGADREVLDARLRQAADYVAALRGCGRDFGDAPRFARLTHALDHELDKTRAQVLSVLALLYPAAAVRDIRSGYFRVPAEEKRAVALELLDTFLSPEHRHRVLPMLEHGLLEAGEPGRLQADPGPPLGAAERLRDLVGNHARWQSRWLKAVALEAAWGWPEARATLELVDQDPTARAAWQWVVAGADSITVEPRVGLTTVEKVRMLRRAPLFAETPEEVLAEMAPNVVEQSVGPGAIIFRRGQGGTTLGIIARGRARIRTGGTTIAQLGPGDVLGELSALVPGPRTADVEAVEDTLLLVLEGETIYQLMEARVEVADQVLRVLCERIRATINQGIYSGAKPPAGALAGSEEPMDESDPAQLEHVGRFLMLRTVGVFSQLPQQVLMSLADLAVEHRLHARQPLFRKGDVGQSLFVVLEGEVLVHDQDRTIARLHSGDIVGEMAVLSAELRSASVTAVRNVRLLEITQEALHELLWDHPEVAKNLIQVLVRRLQKMMI